MGCRGMACLCFEGDGAFTRLMVTRPVSQLPGPSALAHILVRLNITPAGYITVDSAFGEA